MARQKCQNNKKIHYFDRDTDSPRPRPMVCCTVHYLCVLKKHIEAVYRLLRITYLTNS